jgi:hypothetical protein
MPLAALFGHPSPTRPSHCALYALRRTSDDETMTIPGGAGTTHPPVLGAPGIVMGRSSHGGYVRGLRPLALPRSYAARLARAELCR